MPHFVLHCSDDILASHSEATLNAEMHKVANASGLFTESDIKVRVLPFATALVGNKPASFIHVFASIMSGRSIEQRKALSTAMVKQLVALFPTVDNIAMNIDEFDKLTYCNRAQVSSQ